MHVTLEHTQETHEKAHHYFLNASVTFSEAEKYLIKARNLEEFPVIAGLPTAPPTNNINLGFLGPVLLVGGFAFGLAGGAFAAVLMMLLGIALWIWHFVGDHVVAAKHGIRTYTVASLMRDPNIRLFSTDPVGTKVFENELRTNLSKIKQYMDATENLGQKDSFDL